MSSISCAFTCGMQISSESRGRGMVSFRPPEKEHHQSTKIIQDHPENSQSDEKTKFRMQMTGE